MVIRSKRIFGTIMVRTSLSTKRSITSEVKTQDTAPSSKSALVNGSIAQPTPKQPTTSKPTGYKGEIFYPVYNWATFWARDRQLRLRSLDLHVAETLRFAVHCWEIYEIDIWTYASLIFLLPGSQASQGSTALTFSCAALAVARLFMAILSLRMKTHSRHFFYTSNPSPTPAHGANSVAHISLGLSYREGPKNW